MHPRSRLCAFERELSVTASDVADVLAACSPLPWADFLLNPRRLRGSDFLMRWSQGVWSERRIVEAMSETTEFRAIPYGPSGVAPDHDPRAFELYFERLEEAGLGKSKRPDLLVIRREDVAKAEALLAHAGGASELPFIPEDQLEELLQLAVVALECENSLWKAERMPDYGKALRPMRRTGRFGMPKSAVLPTVIVKEEDLAPLASWQTAAGVPIHIWHVFFATTSKTIYKIFYQHAYPVGESSTEPQLLADCIEDRNGHILPYVRFEGGALHLSESAISVLRGLSTGA